MASSLTTPVMTVITPEFQDRLNIRTSDAVHSIQTSVEIIQRRWHDYQVYLATKSPRSSTIAITEDMEALARIMKHMAEHVYVR